MCQLRDGICTLVRVPGTKKYYFFGDFFEINAILRRRYLRCAHIKPAPAFAYEAAYFFHSLRAPVDFAHGDELN
jgi:hypothetical protein